MEYMSFRTFVICLLLGGLYLYQPWAPTSFKPFAGKGCCFIFPSMFLSSHSPCCPIHAGSRDLYRLVQLVGGASPLLIRVPDLNNPARKRWVLVDTGLPVWHVLWQFRSE
jgi:hypothetical protein